MREQTTEPIEGIFTDLGNAEIVPPSWVIDNLLPSGLVFLGAPPKAGKSTLTMAAALLVSGHECQALPLFMSKVIQPGPAIMFSYEAGAGELRHMAEYGMKCRVTANESILICDDPWEFRLDDPGGMKRLLYWASERNPSLIVLDPLRDFHQEDENDSGAMNRLLRPIRQWAIENDASVVVVHHTTKPKEGQSSYEALDLRGTGALFGIADGVIMLTPRPSNQVSIKTIYKRAKGWEATVTLGTYDNAGKSAGEATNEIDKLVIAYLNSNLTADPEHAARVLKMQVARVKESVEKLKRNGYV